MTSTLVRSSGEPPPGPPLPPAVVALVCSAGWLAGLRTVLGGLPADFPAAVVVLQHQRPGQPSHLAWLLDRGCALPVAEAGDGDPLVGGTVTVAPAGNHLLVTVDQRVALVATDGVPPYRPSADLLLASLSIVAPHRSIAVVLSGEGHDGATGATALHNQGGMVIASDEASSAHFAMPRAAISRDEVVDYVLPAEKIAPLLVDLVSGDTSGGISGGISGGEEAPDSAVGSKDPA